MSIRSASQSSVIGNKSTSAQRSQRTGLGSIEVQWLVVAGGGGGGKGGTMPGGGGGGGVLGSSTTGQYALPVARLPLGEAITVTVGAGGSGAPGTAASRTGSPSVFGYLEAFGGGGGGTYGNPAPADNLPQPGGSGGGMWGSVDSANRAPGYYGTTTEPVRARQGSQGGDFFGGYFAASPGCGGGGAGGDGQPWKSNVYVPYQPDNRWQTSWDAGFGGQGKASSITGTSLLYGGGGGGGWPPNPTGKGALGGRARIVGGTPGPWGPSIAGLPGPIGYLSPNAGPGYIAYGAGPLGGGGTGGMGGPVIFTETAGTANTGGGGGGSADPSPGTGAGGSGVVIVRWLTAEATAIIGAGLTASQTTDGSYTVLSLTAGSDTVTWV